MCGKDRGAWRDKMKMKERQIKREWQTWIKTEFGFKREKLEETEKHTKETQTERHTHKKDRDGDTHIRKTNTDKEFATRGRCKKG